MRLEDDYRIYELRNPSAWGSTFWNFLYLSILGMPVTLTAKQSKELSNLLQNFHHFLPCAECRYHYSKEISKVSFNLKTRSDALNMVLSLHNKVRKRQSKPILDSENVISYLYSTVDKSYIWFIVIIIVSIIIFLQTRGARMTAKT